MLHNSVEMKCSSCASFSFDLEGAYSPRPPRGGSIAKIDRKSDRRDPLAVSDIISKYIIIEYK